MPRCCIFQEMYPPKVHQFAYVTDEACTEDDILSMEIIIMKVKKTPHAYNSIINVLVLVSSLLHSIKLW